MATPSSLVRLVLTLEDPKANVPFGGHALGPAGLPLTVYETDWFPAVPEMVNTRLSWFRSGWPPLNIVAPSLAFHVPLSSSICTSVSDFSGSLSGPQPVYSAARLTKTTKERILATIFIIFN